MVKSSVEIYSLGASNHCIPIAWFDALFSYYLLHWEKIMYNITGVYGIFDSKTNECMLMYVK